MKFNLPKALSALRSYIRCGRSKNRKFFLLLHLKVHILKNVSPNFQKDPCIRVEVMSSLRTRRHGTKSNVWRSPGGRYAGLLNHGFMVLKSLIRHVQGFLNPFLAFPQYENSLETFWSVKYELPNHKHRNTSHLFLFRVLLSFSRNLV